tara:strand:- start:3699 stop:3893 length:195 start_codon:yes stop_codon:yes gene_type:complete
MRILPSGVIFYSLTVGVLFADSEDQLDDAGPIKKTWAFPIGQNMDTPEDIEASELILDDRPFTA